MGIIQKLYSLFKKDKVNLSEQELEAYRNFLEEREKKKLNEFELHEIEKMNLRKTK